MAHRAALGGAFSVHCAAAAIGERAAGERSSGSAA